MTANELKQLLAILTISKMRLLKGYDDDYAVLVMDNSWFKDIGSLGLTF